MPKPLARAPKNKATDVVEYKPEDGPFWVAEADAEKPIYFAKTGPASEKGTPPSTLVALMKLAAKRSPNKPALRTENMNALAKGATAPPAKPLAQWKTWTWKQYHDDVRTAASALIELGVEQHDAVNIFGFNSPEWLIGQMSAVFSGAKVAGIYPSDTADQVQFKSFHSNAAVALVENKECLAKYTQVIEDLPYLKAIVCWDCEAGEDLEREDGSVCKTMTWAEFMALGKEAEAAALEERMELIKPGHCCALIYTSGTTGKPKAVMISHDNLIFEATCALPLTGLGMGADERLVSFLPLSHVAGMLFDIISPLVITAVMKGSVSTNFARAYDLKAGTLGARLGAVQPTVFLGVPRVWEKIAEKLQAIGAQTKGLKKKLSTIAKAKGLQASMNQQLGGNGKTPSMYGLFSKLLKIIKGKLGLSECKFACAGAAPMTREILSYFGSLGININEVYGMSESTGATTWSTDSAHEWGTVGFELPGVEVKCFKVAEDGSKTECPLANSAIHPTEEEQGEICFRGRHVMMGYMANPKLGEDHVAEIEKKNSDAIDEEGWLHSGDKGCVSKRGMIRITGRYKELIIGAGGENIAPVPIEDNMKKLCPYISNIMMFGDLKKFNVCLISLKAVGATGEAPGSDKLDGAAKVYGKTITDACNNKKLIADITAALKATGNDGDVTPSNAAKIQKFTILPIDFSVQTGELTATLKLKRSVVADKYADILDAMYEADSVFVPYTTVGSMDAKAADADAVPEGSFKVNDVADEADDEEIANLKETALEEDESPEVVAA